MWVARWKGRGKRGSRVGIGCMLWYASDKPRLSITIVYGYNKTEQWKRFGTMRDGPMLLP